MIKKGFFIFISVSTFLFAVVACDKDFVGLDTNIVGGGNYQFSLYNQASVKAYMQSTGPVQSNNLEVNPLGVFDHPIFGKTTSHFVSQVELIPSGFNPTFGANIVVKNVLLTVPYFNTRLTQNADGSATYRLDSIYGKEKSKMKLSIYENGFFLRSLSPSSNFTQQERYFTNQKNDFHNVRLGADAEGNSIPFGMRLNNSETVAQNDEFFFDRNEIVIVENEGEDNETTNRRAPEMRIQLNKKYFEKKLFSPAGAAAMTNNNTFRNYFRGLYFSVESLSGEPGELAMLNFRGGKVFITYEEDKVDAEGNVTRVEKFLELNLTGNTVSLQDFTNINPIYQNALTSSNSDVGDSKLFVKGGAGSVALIELFGPDLNGNGIADELEEIKSNGWLINEANLVFYIDKEGMGSAPEPFRVFLYDANNKRPLVDYFVDISANSNKPKFGKVIHGGILRKDLTDPLERGESYKIRITDHINNLISRDSTNVKLGLAVTEDIRIINNAFRREITPEGSIDRIPTPSVMSPLGTILFGSQSAVPENKKLQLEIYYTKPN
jgi:hypothetical protein